jgi:hypothetical protein
MSVHQSRPRVMRYIATTRSDDFCVAILSSSTTSRKCTVDRSQTCESEGLGEPIKAGSLCDGSKNLLVEFEIFGFIKTIQTATERSSYSALAISTAPPRRSKENLS